MSNMQGNKPTIDIKNWSKGVITAIPADYDPRPQFANIAVNPDGILRPWPTGDTGTRLPVLKSDGQVTWLPKVAR